MTTYPLESLPLVSPLMVRRFRFGNLAFPCKGGLACVREVACEDVEPATVRLEFDEDVVDCSFAMFALTSELTSVNEAAQRQQPGLTMLVAYFNGRRWRSHRLGRALSWPDDTLLYIGNPIRIDLGPEGIVIHRSSEFSIRSGASLAASSDPSPPSAFATAANPLKA